MLSYYRSLIHGSSLRLISLTYFNPNFPPEFPAATPRLSPIFNFLPFSFCTIYNPFPSQTLSSSATPFQQPLLQSYIKYDTSLDFQVDTTIINPSHSIP